MNRLIERYLESKGWIVECQQPLELYHEESNSRATGMAALALIDYYNASVERTWTDGTREYLKCYYDQESATLVNYDNNSLLTEEDDTFEIFDDYRIVKVKDNQLVVHDSFASDNEVILDNINKLSYSDQLYVDGKRYNFKD